MTLTGSTYTTNEGVIFNMICVQADISGSGYFELDLVVTVTAFDDTASEQTAHMNLCK